MNADVYAFPLSRADAEATRNLNSGGYGLKTHLLEAASQKIPNHHTLVNAVSRRIRQLAAGSRPLTKTLGLSTPTEIALQEIIEGKFIVESIVEEKPKKK